jgi:hypothetical protein
VRELEAILRPPAYKRPINFECWALCSKQGKRWHVRRIVWGREMARAEKREGETIKRAAILLKETKHEV